MMETTVRFYTLGYREARTYLVATLFVAGNILLPQLFHLVPQGGATWLPIYFFTLIGAYKYGWQVGLLTAICSPLINAGLFGMPPIHALPAILLKSTLLALLAGWTAYRYRRVTLLLLLGVVLGYQLLGSLGEWAMGAGLYAAAQDFRIGIPGMLLQVLGGYFMIKYLIRK